MKAGLEGQKEKHVIPALPAPPCHTETDWEHNESFLFFLIFVLNKASQPALASPSLLNDVN